MQRISALIEPGRYFVWNWHYGDEDSGCMGVRILSRDAVRLEYAVDGADASQTVALSYSACHFGGDRPWFVCPACGRRAGVLFHRGARFACRKCQRVAYASQSEDACGRAWRVQNKIERRLGDDWSRPKGMRQATHSRLIERLSECAMARDRAVAAMLRRLMA